MVSITGAQIRTIHTLKSRAGLDDESYRDMLHGTAGVSSSKALTRDGAIRVIDRLKMLSAQVPSPGPSGHPLPQAGEGRKAVVFSGPYAGICRALWISGWHLGVVTNRRDEALAAFVRRQTGLDHLNWLRDWEDALRVIEALKKWLAREAGVAWPKRGDPGAMKAAVIAAQLRLLGDATTEITGDLDELMTELGARVRKLKKTPSPGASRRPRPQRAGP